MALIDIYVCVCVCACFIYIYICTYNFTLEQATKAQRGSGGIALLFL